MRAPRQNAFAGFFFRLPEEIHVLTALPPAQLKVFLVVMHAIQRDRNCGLLAIRMIAERARLTNRNAREAVEALCAARLLVRVNRATGAELTSAAEWNGRTVKYAFPVQWRQKDTSNLTPTGIQFSEDGGKPAPIDAQGVSNLTPVGIRNLTPVGIQHSEFLELLELNTATAAKCSVVVGPPTEHAAAAKKPPKKHRTKGRLRWKLIGGERRSYREPWPGQETIQ